NGARSLQGDMLVAGSLTVRNSFWGRSATTGQSGRWNIEPVRVATNVPAAGAAAAASPDRDDAAPLASAAPSSFASMRARTSIIWRSAATMRVSQDPEYRAAQTV